MSLPAILLELAPKYYWWRDETAPSVRRIVAQIMNLGDLRDVLRVEEVLGRDVFLDALQSAQPGWYAPRSWSFWNYRLGQVDGGVVPDIPKRRIP